MELIIETDADQVAETLARRGLDILQVLEGALDRGAFRVEAGMKVYPPPPSGSTYVRTGTLGRRWTTKPIREANTVGREIGNNTDYGPVVQSEELQAYTHRGRWQTDADVLRRETPAIVRDVDEALRDAVGGW
jgi:hypothetical protein